MNAPQIILIVLFAMSLGMSLATHGQIKERKENFFISFLANALVFAILVWGAFFS